MVDNNIAIKIYIFICLLIHLINRYLASAMKNVQISFGEDLLKTIDQYAKTARLTRSALVREAVKTWIRQAEITQFEDTWIQKLKENPDDLADSDAWLKAEKWGDE